MAPYRWELRAYGHPNQPLAELFDRLRAHAHLAVGTGTGENGCSLEQHNAPDGKYVAVKTTSEAFYAIFGAGATVLPRGDHVAKGFIPQRLRRLVKDVEIVEVVPLEAKL